MEAAWSQIESLFHEALALDESERDAYLRSACSGRPALYTVVGEMLAAHARPLEVEPGLLSGDLAWQQGARRGTLVGGFRLLEPLGHGGMGSVWLAEYVDGPLDRKVALKLVRLPFVPDDALALRRRFASEQRIMGRLAHPGIVRLLEAGVAASGPGGSEDCPYFAMDYVAGVPITEHANATGLRIADRLRLFVQVCDAVHHAHQRLVIHRDLKPSNILVAPDEAGRPQVKLLDFGIAKLLEDDGMSGPLPTETGVRPMTRAYAAPEQVRGEPATTSTDVYALGVVLYELITGVRPFEASTAVHLEAAILTDVPLPPRTALVRTGTSPPGIESRDVRSDLDVVVLTALRKEPSERYASAEAFGADVLRYVEGRPVRARPPSAVYRMRTFVRRHRSGVAVAASALFLLVAFTILLIVQQRATARERDAASATAEFLEGLFGAADPFAGERLDTLRIVDLLDQGVARARVELAGQPFVRARLLLVIGRAYVRVGNHPKADDPLDEAVRLLRQGGDRIALAWSLAELASARNARWLLAEAESMAREALSLAERTDDPALRAYAEYVLARTLTDAGRPEEAETLLRESLERTRTLRGPEHSDAVSAELALARCLLDQGRLDESEDLLLALRRRVSRADGPADPRLVSVLSPLTFLYLMSGRIEDARAAGAEAVTLARAMQPGSSTLGQLLATYAAVQLRANHLDEAELLVREALDLPPMRAESPAIPLGTLASILHRKGDLEGAIEAQRRSIDLQRSANRQNAASIAFSERKLAGFLLEAGREDEAEHLAAAADSLVNFHSK